MLKDFNKFSIHYVVKLKNGIKVSGHFKDLKIAANNPDELSEFIDINDDFYVTYKISSKHIKKYSRNISAKADPKLRDFQNKYNVRPIRVMTSAPIGRQLRNLLNENTLTAYQTEDNYIFKVPKNVVILGKLNRCFIGTDSIVQLYMRSKGKYKKPSNLSNYKELVKLFREIEADDHNESYPQTKLGITIEKDKIYFNNVGFKIRPHEAEVIKNIDNHWRKYKRPASNFVAFKNVATTENQIANLLSDIDNRNHKNHYKIREVIISMRNPKNRDSAYKIDIPDYW